MPDVRRIGCTVAVAPEVSPYVTRQHEGVYEFTEMIFCLVIHLLRIYSHNIS